MMGHMCYSDFSSLALYSVNSAGLMRNGLKRKELQVGGSLKVQVQCFELEILKCMNHSR